MVHVLDLLVDIVLHTPRPNSDDLAGAMSLIGTVRTSALVDVLILIA
jgi:hypothetical protein